MKRLKSVTTAGTPAFAGSRERRKSYYHGKYSRQLTSVAFVLALVVFCFVRLNG